MIIGLLLLKLDHNATDGQTDGRTGRLNDTYYST